MGKMVRKVEEREHEHGQKEKIELHVEKAVKEENNVP